MTNRIFYIGCLIWAMSATALFAQRSMQRIDREIQKTVFIPRGTWMAGGTVSYSEHNEENLNMLVLKNIEGKGYDFTVSPYFGYFFLITSPLVPASLTPATTWISATSS